MGVFNTKKSRIEQAKMIEESYNQGKNDAIEEALSTIDKGKEDKSKWNKLSEKELLVELIYMVNLNNMRIDNLNNKVNFILNYESLFKGINDELDKLNEHEKELSKQVAKASVLVSNYETDVNEFTDKLEGKVTQIKDNVSKIKKTLDEIVKNQSLIDKVADMLYNSIPNLNDACEQIEKIALKVNNIVETYSDNPTEVLKNIEKSTNDLTETLIGEFHYGENIFDVLDSIRVDVDDLSYTLDEIKSDISNVGNNY